MAIWLSELSFDINPPTFHLSQDTTKINILINIAEHWAKVWPKENKQGLLLKSNPVIYVQTG